MKQFRRYYNPRVETSSSDQLRVREEEKLRRQVRYVFDHSPFYQEKFAAAGAKPEDIRTAEDLQQLPFTTKDEVRASQTEDPPFGRHRAAPPAKIVRLHATSGTTGRLTYIGLTRRDHRVWCEAGARTAWCMGLRPTDTVVHCLNYSLWGGGIADHMNLETTQACVVPLGTGQTQRFLELYRQWRATAMFAITSYAFYLAEAAQAQGIVPSAMGLRLLLLGGEAGASIPSTRAQLQDIWGATIRDGMYGMAEVLASFAGECEEQDGLHFCGQEILLTELIDPQSERALSFRDGAVGELVYTMLDREATPLIRFRSRDLGEVVTRGCACGRTGFRLKLRGRSDDMFFVRGVNVYPTAIEEVIRSLRPALTGEFFVTIDAESVVPPVDICAEHGEAVGSQDLDGLRRSVEQELRRRLNFAAAVQLVPPGQLPKTEQKRRRVFKRHRGDLPPC
jgi:phenylacetate-CoA ligase